LTFNGELSSVEFMVEVQAGEAFYVTMVFRQNARIQR
jgi:hypothetical protein